MYHISPPYDEDTVKKLSPKIPETIHPSDKTEICPFIFIIYDWPYHNLPKLVSGKKKVIEIRTSKVPTVNKIEFFS